MRNKTMIDLHVHSNRSDGTLTPRELVDYACKKGLRTFALTDHDTIEGLEEAITYANQLRTGLLPLPKEITDIASVPEVIPGIEFSTEYEGRDIHIVGLAINYQNPAFIDKLSEFVASRITRNKKMCRLLQEAGIDITYDKLLEEFPDAVITRAHYAKYLFNHGYIQSMNEAFDRYVGDHCPCYVPREKVTPIQAVALILAVGGIPILAHPILYHMSDERLEQLVCKLKAAGLIGMEAIYSTYNTAEERQIRRLADKYHLLISGGSDFHGANKPKIDLGVGLGKLFVPDEIWENLKKTQQKILFSDMDGTLLLSNSTISPAMKEAIGQMTALGHHLVLSSGRPLPSILEVCDIAGLSFPHMLIMSNNGALVYDCDSKRPILEYRIAQTDIETIISRAHAAGIHIHGYTEKEIVCLHDNEELRFYTRRIHLPLKCVEDIAKALPEGSYKLQAIHLTDKSILEHFRDSLLEDASLMERIQMFFSNDQYLEILPAGADKGSALQFVTDYLPVLRTNTFAAGDAENDITMLEAAYTGIAMKNGSEEVKKHANIITPKSNDEDGLVEIIREFFI
ncbi:MAG: Cof-type HAD-IIB family hydrolase [Lachnospiraceae bacterium]|nr:Cof-type HAD-IIB family hydrolase [Lachnospiraceae bacterium]